MIGIEGSWVIVLSFVVGFVVGVFALMGFVYALLVVAKIFNWNLKRREP